MAFNDPYKNTELARLRGEFDKSVEQNKRRRAEDFSKVTGAVKKRIDNARKFQNRAAGIIAPGTMASNIDAFHSKMKRPTVAASATPGRKPMRIAGTANLQRHEKIPLPSEAPQRQTRKELLGQSDTLGRENANNIRNARFYPRNNGEHRVGNLDVTFDPSVSREARQAFLQDPVRPTAAIERFKNRRPVQVFSNRSAQHDYGKNVATGPEFLTKRNAPDLGWKERRAINQEIGANYREGLKSQTSMDTTRLSDAGMTNRTRMTEGGANERARMVNELGREQNAIRESELMSQNRSQSVIDEQNRLALEQQQEIQDTISQMNADDVTPEQRRKLQLKLYSLQGKQPNKYQTVTSKNVDPETGQPVWTNYLVDDQGQSRRIGDGAVAQNAPQQAIDFLAKNPSPQNKEFFRRKYGYLPDGV